MRRFKMKNRRRVRSTAFHHFVQRCVPGNAVLDVRKVDSAPPKCFGVAGYQLPMMLFAAKAENCHAHATNRWDFSSRERETQPVAVCTCWEAIISRKISSSVFVSFQFG